MFPALPREEPGLETDKTQGQRSTRGSAQHPAAIGMQAGRNIDGEYRSVADVHGFDGGAPLAFQRALQAGTEQGVDNHIACLQGARR